jgi:hypothetical protein
MDAQHSSLYETPIPSKNTSEIMTTTTANTYVRIPSKPGTAAGSRPQSAATKNIREVFEKFRARTEYILIHRGKSA